MRYPVHLLAVFAAYFVAGKAGLALASINTSATAVWPPTGIAIAAGLVLGYRIWPAVFAGAFLVNITTTGDLVSSLGIAAGNTLEGLAGAYLVDRFANGRHFFMHLNTLARFALLGALVAPVVSASIGVTSLALVGRATDLGPIWWTWWLGDVGGALVVAPLVVLWATRVPRLRGEGSTLELAALAVAVAVVTVIVFTPASPLAAMNYPIGFVVLPILVWPVVRFGPRVALTTAATLSAVAVWGTVRHAGPWVRPTENESLLLVQAFMGIASLTILALAAAVLERQQAEDALRATEERLRLAEERKVAARDEFLSVAAHELKTPLTSLQLAVQFLLRQASAGKIIAPDLLVQALTPVASQSARLGELVAELLDTVRIQANRMDLVVSEQDVAALTERVARELQATTARHDIVVTAQHVTAPLDPLRYEQVLRNLLDNAIKYSPGGRIAVDVARSDGVVEVSVRDHGPGIAAEIRDRIFDRFYQATPEGHRNGGLGLGLHVSRHIVELHGGDIRAEFPSDGGTRMIVRLPTRVEDAREREEALAR